MRRAALAWFLLCAVPALGGRPPEAIEADQDAAEAEVRDLERRARALDDQAAERRERLKRRLRALYKLSSGGTLRLLAGAETASDLAARHEALRRVLARDLDELGAVRDEAREVDEEQAQRQEALGRSLLLGRELASTEAPTGLAARATRLHRPVPGPVVAGFGAYQDRATGLELSRRGAELRAAPGMNVRAIANGRVVWVGDAPGLGRAVAIDHGEGYTSLSGHLREATVTVGELVIEGGRIGLAAQWTVYFELAQNGTAFDAASWLTRAP